MSSHLLKNNVTYKHLTYNHIQLCPRLFIPLNNFRIFLEKHFNKRIFLNNASTKILYVIIE